MADSNTPGAPPTGRKKRVLITGAAGRIGSSLAERLKDRYELRLHYHRTIPEQPPVADTIVADISRYEEIAPAMDGIDAVVHMAADPSTRASWEDVHQRNIVGTYNVYEAARRAGVGAVVFASSNHAIGMYELDGAPELYELDDPRVYDHTVEVRPDSLYGVSKVYGEALGRYYMERHDLRVFCLRIGAVRAQDDPTSPEVLASSPPLLNLRTEEERRQRMRAVWLSRRDCAQLIARCLDAEHVRWAVVYGISNNPRQFWDLRHARELLGYEPRDAAPE